MKTSDWLKYLLHAAILIGLVVAAVKYLNGAEVLAAFARFDYIYAPFLVALSALYLGLKSLRFVWLMRPVSDLPWGVPFRGYVAGQAATLVPGGVAARAGLMKQAGVPVSRSSAPVAYSSILDQAVFIGSSLVAALFFPAATTVALILLLVIFVLGLVLALPFTRGWLDSAGIWLAGRFNLGDKWRSFLEAMRRLFTLRLMLASLAITVLAFSLKVVALDLTLRGLGFSLPYPELFLVYILPTMLGRLSALPAGVGVTEASMVGFLVAISALDAETATAASVLFRIATVVVEAAIGAIFYAFFWRGDAEAASSRSPGRGSPDTPAPPAGSSKPRGQDA